MKSLSAPLLLSVAVAVTLICHASAEETRPVGQIFIKTQAGQTITIDVEPSDTVGLIKSKIADKEGVPANQQRIAFGDKQLDDDKTLQDCGVQLGDTLFLMDSFKWSSIFGGGGGNSKNVDKDSEIKSDNKYFDVDANDAEAVKQKQRELSEEKFKELFGADAVFDIDYQHNDNGEPASSEVSSVLKWLADKLKLTSVQPKKD